MGHDAFMTQDIVLAPQREYLQRWTDEATPEQMSALGMFTSNTPSAFTTVTPWAAWYNTFLLIELMLKGAVLSFLILFTTVTVSAFNMCMLHSLQI